VANIKEVLLPDIGDFPEVDVIEVLVGPGDKVEAEESLITLESDKATMEIPSPYAGEVKEIKVKVGDKIGQDALIALIDASDAAEGEAAPTEAAEGAVPHTASEETEQVQAPAPAPVEPPPKSPSRLPGEKEPTRPPVLARPADHKGGKPHASPAVRRFARELGVDLHEVPPSGPAGRVTSEDVRAFAEREEREEKGAAGGEERAARATLVEVPEVIPHGRVPSLPDFERWGEVERIPLRSVRRATAKQMALSWSQVPHVNHQDKVDITALERFRERHKAEIEGEGGRLTPTVLAMKAVVAALKQHPRFNASLDPASEEIILKQYYHLGIAVDTDRGLLVPVIRDVDRKSIRELSIELYEMVQRTRSGEASLDELQGGTFTITNIGILGGTAFFPIINFPEVAILGMARARWEPVVRRDEEGTFETEPRYMLPLMLCFDHRVVDGADAARFVGVVKEALETPERLLLTM